MKALMPRIEIALSQIRHNARILSELYGQKGISLMGVSKATLGEPSIAKAMIQGGVKFIADSRLENIQKMKNAGILTQFILLRTAFSQAESVITNVDISLNTELETVTELSHYANVQNKLHQIIIMVELGDLREGILPCDLSQFVKKTLDLSNIKIIGIGCNLACYGGIKPDNQKMSELSQLANGIEKEFQINLEIISGGNSANYEWYESAQQVGRINNLRLGESILLGCETVNRKAIPGLYTSAFKLIAEVIESKEKPSLPFGEICQNAFGNVPTFLDRGIRRRVIIALGRQDILVSGLKPNKDLEILGSSSDHVVLDSNNYDLKVGSEVKFNLDYGALLSAMTSPFIKKQFIGCS
ncbi:MULTISPECIES: alanine/ornithine racemase family PLP-dependent enzyme [unclassified Coleofasciculus]|uniref:alanine/ornithine racemase family PLP-dependent enzyme n=1 Tax=unclassified Coleofasciculus TaxID=2692782 RepID=UPI0018812A0C|nr:MULTISPECIES: alanine/ornithine racemase family PLP-dependent enzyme [unclassified Coleofasciculus]MBE9125013.1 alanine/ornithine racemase family PLP-dependent enzyme [Coleofasciculus sp. LEGE 07081]MBE9147667.1 alanine/ornithine racemase family PLP-dependent enzyme [Coleofasciculus sp. LEGE 07092]